MTQLFVICGALVALLLYLAIASKRDRTAQRPLSTLDKSDRYIDEMVARAETDSMKNAIRLIAEAQRDPWLKFDQPVLADNSDRSGGISMPASNVVALSRSRGPVKARVCDRTGLDQKDDK